MRGSVDPPKLVQFFKSKSDVVLINTDSKSRHRQHQETDHTSGLLFPEAQTTTWTSCIVIQMTLPTVMNLASRTSDGRPHAIISSTGETRASQPETQSDLMNDHSEDFVPIDRGSGMIFLLMVMSKGRLWSGKSRKRSQIWYAILTLPNEKTDGAVHWNSMCPKVRRALQSEGAQTSSDSCWLDYIYKGSNKNRFQHCKNPNTRTRSLAAWPSPSSSTRVMSPKSSTRPLL